MRVMAQLGAKYRCGGVPDYCQRAGTSRGGVSWGRRRDDPETDTKARNSELLLPKAKAPGGSLCSGAAGEVASSWGSHSSGGGAARVSLKDAETI